MLLLREAVDFISDESAESLVEPGEATYRTSAGSVQLPVVLGQTRYDVLDSDGATITGTCNDILCEASDLVIDGEGILPTPGDTIELTDGRVLEVLEIGGGEHFRYSDPLKRRLRIHTKDVDTVAPTS